MNLLVEKGEMQTLDQIKAFEDDWDGYDSPAPRAETIACAEEALALFRSDALAQGLYWHWQEPNVSGNERGQIVLEWWQDDRSLTIFFRTLDQIDYLKSWGKNIEIEMEDGELTHTADFAPLFRWLCNNRSSKSDR